MFLWIKIAGLFTVFTNGIRCLELYDIQQWCNVTSEWRAYNSTKSICFQCEEGTKLLESWDEAKMSVCCRSGVGNEVTVREKCNDWPRNTDGIRCSNNNKFLQDERCDEFNHCGDGSDEKDCENQPVCENQYRCDSGSSQPKCFAVTDVCNRKKDCRKGQDEINCIYHAGRCEGYLCNFYPECISKEMVCNGAKDCLDGTDEIDCIGADINFSCNAAVSSNNTTSIPTSKICNGVEDCSSKIDEIYCYTWIPWALWSTCDCSRSNPLQFRHRKCINSRLTESPAGKCIGALSNETQSCSCVTTVSASTTAPESLELQWIIVIAVAILILVISTIGIICVAWYNKRTKEAMEKQAETVAHIYNQSVISLSPRPAETTPTFAYPSSSAPGVGISPSRPATKRINEALPLTPLEMINHTYESIGALTRQAESSNTPNYQPSTSRSTMFSIVEASESSEDEATVVNSYSISHSESKEEYLKTPPPLPKHIQEKDGYLVPNSVSNESITDGSVKKNVVYAKLKQPVKPPRLRHKSQILISEPTGSDDQYATMRSFSADGIFCGPAAMQSDRENVGQSVRFRDPSKVSKNAARRVKSLGNLTETGRDCTNQLQYSTMRSPLKEGKTNEMETSTPEQAAIDSHSDIAPDMAAVEDDVTLGENITDDICNK